MNLYEFEGKNLFAKHGILVPKGVVVRRGEDYAEAYDRLGAEDVVVKAQVLVGGRGKSSGIRFCGSREEVVRAREELFAASLQGQYVIAALIEEKLDIREEHYLSITYDTRKQKPVLIYSREGGVEIETVPQDKISRHDLDVRYEDNTFSIPYMRELWACFLAEDARLTEINPLVKTSGGVWYAADAKIILDDDAFFRHEEWQSYEPRTIMGRLLTERELAVKRVDEGENYYRGTAGKYIEMDGDIAVLFSGGGASIANMDALLKTGLRPANYTEYSGNPPREKVYELTKVVLSKPDLKGLWIVGGVANFTNIQETFQGIVDALDEIKPKYPIVVRRAGPSEGKGMRIMRECRERNSLHMKLFGKEVSMSETAKVLRDLVEAT